MAEAARDGTRPMVEADRGQRLQPNGPGVTLAFGAGRTGLVALLDMIRMMSV